MFRFRGMNSGPYQNTSAALFTFRISLLFGPARGLFYIIVILFVFAYLSCLLWVTNKYFFFLYIGPQLIRHMGDVASPVSFQLYLYQRNKVLSIKLYLL